MGASNLVGGIYDSETRTITWEQELGAIDTFRYGEKEVNFSRDITVKYIYDDEENLSEPIENRVEGTVTLTQGEEPVVEDTKEDTHETIVEIPAKVIVHHYIYDEEKGGYTDIKIAPDEEQKGLVGDEYSTHKAEVGADYECINETPDKYQGTMTKTDIEVIYYYELKDVVTESTITKDATASTETEIDGQIVPVLTDEDGEVTYNIAYTVGVDSYQGKVTLQLIDYLPYEIDTEKSNIGDGIYNQETKTITWTIEKDIDTFTQGKYSETINKQITVVYKDQDVNAVLENRVVGKLTIYYPEEHSTNPGGVRHEEEKEDTAEVMQDYKVDRTVTKVWDHTNNIYTIPSQIKVQVKNGEELVREQVLTEADKTAENTWTYTFANLDKYDAEGNEINYTIDEVEVEEGDLGYYRKDIEGLTIKNTYIGPVISQVKTAETENGLDYVIEGEKVTYSITVRNDGQIAKDVLVQDTIPEGTSFVENSIKVNNEGTEYTSDNLADGITVNVAGNTSVTVTFEVTVNELPEGIFEYIIRNTAIVDGKPTEEVTEEVNKPNVIPSKSSTPDNGTEVKVGDPITYTITLDNSKGTAPDTVVVKDNIPEGTTFVEGSIKINDVPTEETAETLANGIEVHLNPAEIKEVEFQVTVNDLDNGTPIRNVATVDEEPTNEITHTYIEPIISGTKEMTTQRGLSYVIPGEEITYTIKVKNEGDLGKNIVVQDTIPEGTEFANGSVLLDGQHSEITKEQLEAGINIEMEGQSEHTVSFKVIVLEGATEVKNTATVDGTETNETKVPVLDYEKTAEIIKQTAEELPEGTATAGDKIRYTIKVSNLGEEATESIEVKDVVPEGTTLSKIENSGKVNDKNEITWTIESIATGEYAEVSFEVTINYDIVENKVITNIATVDGEETNETDTPYDKPEIKEESSLEKTGTEKINSTQEAISYKITYNAIVKDFVGEGRVTIVDYLPYEIEEEKSELNEGIYDANAKTITWEEDLGTIDTYLNGEKDIEIIKDITVKYVYGEAEETLSGTIPNRVTSNLELRQEDPENPEEDKTVLEDPKEDTFETKVEVPTEVIVHHYIEGTTIKVPSKVYGEEVEDEIKEGYAGEEYTTAPTENAQENYKVVGNSGNTEGIMTQTTIEVIYYYQLQPGDIVENTITKDGTDRITNRDDKVSYTIVYTGEVRNYVGNAKVEIIDYLPYAIDESVSNIAGGTYNPETKTITWIEDLGRVNTYVNGDKEIEITKNIEVVYAEMDYRGESFINKAQGKITLEETNQEEETPEAEKETETELEKDLIAEKEWDDNEDIKGRRPESVTIQLTANGKVVNNINDIDNSNNTTEEENNDNENTEAQEENNIGNTETQGENSNIENVEESNNIENTLSVEEVTNEEQTFRVVLNEANNWIHTFENLPKYTEDGQEIEYNVIEEETVKGDLEYYEEPKIEIFDRDTNAIIRITNKYRLTQTDLEAKIEKTGTDKITSTSQEVNYNIKYNATVEDYIGEALVTIVDYLPYDIDETKSDLAGGEYDSVARAIIWKERIEHINTYTEGAYNVNIEKDIKVVYTNIDATLQTMTNRVIGVIDLYENETTNKQEDTYETKVEVPGNVIVKYVDKDTGEEITYEEQNDEGQIEEKTYGYELNGLAGDKYNTELKNIYGYTFVESTNNTSGIMIEGTIEVIYYYTRTDAGGVIAHYVDEEGNKLAEDEIIKGKVKDPYKTEQKDIPNYDFVRVEGETEGEMIEGVIEVTYIYKKIPAKVIVQYLEKDETPEDNSDNKVLAEEETIEGYSGDEYTTTRKEIENYQATDPEPENSKGTMTREDIYVIYYYERKPSGIVTVKYVDVDTNEEILRKVELPDGSEEYTSYREQMSGLCGLEYTTEQKDIPYYNFVEDLRPSNAKGIYTEEDIEVIYYYRKQEFNLGVEKQITRITVNGVEHTLQELNQIDIVASKVAETDVVVTYKIVVSNPSEIEGSTRVIENIPEFFEVIEGTSAEWVETENGTLETVIELQPGKTRELTVVLRWKKEGDNFGLQVNTVTLSDVENPANYEETNLEDNSAKAEVILSVKTGGIDTSIVIGTALIVMIGALMITIYLKEKNRK